MRAAPGVARGWAHRTTLSQSPLLGRLSRSEFRVPLKEDVLGETGVAVRVVQLVGGGLRFVFRIVLVDVIGSIGCGRMVDNVDGLVQYHGGAALGSEAGSSFVVALGEAGSEVDLAERYGTCAGVPLAASAEVVSSMKKAALLSRTFSVFR